MLQKLGEIIIEKSNATRQLEDFGIKIYILAILSIISIFIGGIIHFVMFIILLVSLGDIKKANLELKNEHLEKFRKYIIYAVIVGIIGALIITVITVFVAILFISAIPGFTFSSPITIPEFLQMVPLINTLMLVLLGGFPIEAVALGLLIIAWKNLQMFLETNFGSFPNTVAPKAIDGSKNIKRSYLYLLIALILGEVLVLIAIFGFPQIQTLIMDFILAIPPSMGLWVGFIVAIGILGFIIGILGIISYILMIIGYFELSKLKRL